MIELVQAGGWVMLPIVACSVVAAGICIERAWSLRVASVAPDGLLAEVRAVFEDSAGDVDHAAAACGSSGLGRILKAGILGARHGREAMKEAMQDAAAAVVHELERHLTALGAIASVSPMLGLLGTVIGMIRVFAVLMETGTTGIGALAGGISEALVTTAAGLGVAIPALICHRFLMRKVDDLVVTLEDQAGRLVAWTYPEPQS